MRLILLVVLVFVYGCSKPVDVLQETPKIALVNVVYDTNIYLYSPTEGIKDNVFAPFSGKLSQFSMHETLLNEFLIEFMRKTKLRSDVSFVRPLKLLNTSLLSGEEGIIQYEYILDPYDPIDISNAVFMAGLAKTLNVDAVAAISITYAVYLDEVTLWEEYNDPYAKTLSSHRMQVQYGHETSYLRTQIKLVVVDQFANTIYTESRYVDVDSDDVVIDNNDLNFDGGVSPKLLRKGLNEWLFDWAKYIPKYMPQTP